MLLSSSVAIGLVVLLATPAVALPTVGLVTGVLTAAAAVLAQAVNVAVVVALSAAALILPDVVTPVGCVASGLLVSIALVIAAVSSPWVALLASLLTLLALPTLLGSAAVLAIHVLVFALLARIGPSLAALLIGLVVALLTGLLLTRLLLTGLLVLGVSVPDVLMRVGLVVLTRPLLAGSPRAVSAVRGVSATPLAVVHLFVLILSVVPSTSPTAPVLIVSCHGRILRSISPSNVPYVYWAESDKRSVGAGRRRS